MDQNTTPLPHYVILNENLREDRDPLYWSNKYGWVQLWDATVFSFEEMKTLNLPVGGKWSQLPEIP